MIKLNSIEEIAKQLTKIHKYTIDISDLEFSAWTQTFGGTNPFGPGGNMITDHIVFCWRNKIHNDCVLVLLGRKKYYKFYKSDRRTRRGILHANSRNLSDEEVLNIRIRYFVNGEKEDDIFKKYKHLYSKSGFNKILFG